MSFRYTWLGHSAFLLSVDGHTVLIDPFLTGNPLAAAAADELQPELILLTHAHSDHLGDTVAIAQRTGAKVVTNIEIGDWMNEHHGLTNVEGMNIGGTVDCGFATIKVTYAQHSSAFPGGGYGGPALGFIVTPASGSPRLYFAGDTGLFGDMALIGDNGIDIAFLPIGDYYTMGIEDSLRAIPLVRPRYVVPMHYNTFDVIVQNVAEWALRVSRETRAQPVVLDPGGSFELA